ncbi:hypothetical protein [Sphingobacterium thermophilum]|uniref:Phosphoenolpyruvate carboxykinase (ATP) n=1 Tax=Sphingobacterium thermophilum TaxID=768534 RepID=A0ABP8R0F0_9SPHI
MTTQSIYYSIADLQLNITFPSECNLPELLPNFEPFRVSFQSDKPISCSVTVTEEEFPFERDKAKLLSDISIVWGDNFTFYETEEAYYILIKTENDPSIQWKMRSSKDFRKNVIYCGPIDKPKNQLISWFCMVAFAQSALLHQCVMIHASVVMNDEGGYAFLGKSGTGKSTHSKLWLTHNEGFELLNDDNPALRIVDEEVRVYGTPWSGKTPCYRAESRPLKALVRLRQAPHNIFYVKEDKDALLALLPSCSAIRWNLNLYSTLINILVVIIDKVKIGELHCLPDKEAAQICFSHVQNYNK